MRVLLVDDHQIMREGLCLLLEAESDIRVVGEASDGMSAIEAVRRHRPDVVVMDVSMPGLNGIDATRRLVKQFPGVRVLCLSMHADQPTVSAVLHAGASGYVPKECTPAELVTALRAVTINRTYLSPAVAGGVIRDYVDHLSKADAFDVRRLTEREREVLQLIAEGQPTKSIAARLHISVKTVATHREHIKTKLDLHSVAELTKYSIRQRLTTVDQVAPG